MPGKFYAPEQKLKFYQYWKDSDKSIRQAERDLGLSTGTLNRIIRQVELEGTLALRRHPNQGNKKILTKEHQQVLNQLLEQNPKLSCKKIAQLLLERTGAKYPAYQVCYQRRKLAQVMAVAPEVGLHNKKIVAPRRLLSKKQRELLCQLLRENQGVRDREIIREFQFKSSLKISPSLLAYYKRRVKSIQKP
jgi:transposase